MADDGKKTYSEDEHLAILSDRVTKETAGLTGQVTELTGTTTELQNKLDIAESAKSAAEQERDTAKKEFEDFKAGVEQREAAAAKKDVRIQELRESAKHLKDEFFDEASETGQARVARIVAMSDETFDGYKADLALTAVDVTPGGGTPPRETAMSGASANETHTESAARSHLLRGRLVTSSQEG